MYIVAVLFTSAPLVRAQDVDQSPAHVAFVDGVASLEREGQTEQAAAGAPFVPGDRLRTESGRVEILFPDGSALDVDEFASVDLQSPTLLRVTSGRVMLTVAGANSPSAAIRYQIDTPVASAMTDGPGEFRVALLSGPSGLETELAVLRGSAALTTERGTTAVRAGERSLARDNESPRYPQAFNSARFDAFDRWSAAHRSARTGNAASAQHLPSDLQMYGGTLDRYGAWQYNAPYGHVWYPTVAADWRPYYDGYWSSLRPYGWTWIGFDVWAWPTHHYGRWGLAQNRWFWIPERHWAAAWVSWGAAPGYVSWCPLGFDNGPVFGLTVANSWAGWVVVPGTHFGGSYVRQWAIAPHRLHATTPFVVQASAPAPPTHAIPRPNGVAASRSAGVAVPRTATGGSSQQSIAGSQQSAVRNQFSADRSRPSAAPRQPVAIERPGQAGTGLATADWGRAGADRSRPTADHRPLSEDRRLQTPGSGVLTVDRRPPTADHRQQADTWLKQPLPEVPRAYRRNPGAPAAGDGAPNASPYRQVVPRWGSPGSASSWSAPAAQPTAPLPPAPAAGAWPRTAVPQAEFYSWGRTPARNDPTPRPESAPPRQAERPVPASRSPATAAPRSGPPPAAPTAPPQASQPSSSGAGGGGGAHGHGSRHP